MSMTTGQRGGHLSFQSSTTQTWLWPLLAGFLSILFYMFNLERPPHPDELYHVLAARGFIESGEYRIAEGIYERGALQTWMSAQMMMWFGDTLAVARMPSVLIMGAVNALLAAWLVWRAGFTASLIAVILFAVSPFAVETAQLVRFYAPQVLAFLAGVLLVFETRMSPRRWWIYIPPALFAFWLAIDLQPTSVMGLLALAIWLGLTLLPHWLAMLTGGDGRLRLLAIAIPVLLAIAGLVLIVSPLGADFWYQYRWVPAFNRHVTDQFYFYHGWFLLYYPVLWPFLGLICLLAIRAHPNAGFLCSALFVTSFLLASFAGTKGLRYFVFAQPFFFAMLGMALAPLPGMAIEWLKRLCSDFAALIPMLGERGRQWLAGALVAMAMLFLIVANGAVVRTLGLMAGVSIGPEKADVDWRAALPELRPYLEDADIVVTMADLETLFYIGDFDLFLVPPGVDGKPDQADYSQDYRTGKTVIGTPQAIERIMACYNSGLFLTNMRRWGVRSMSNVETEKFIETHAQKLELPAASRVLAFHWQAPVAANGQDCNGMPVPVRDRQYD